MTPGGGDIREAQGDEHATVRKNQRLSRLARSRARGTAARENGAVRSNPCRGICCHANTRVFHGVTERGIAMVGPAGLAAKLQAPLLFPGADVPQGD